MLQDPQMMLYSTLNEDFQLHVLILWPLQAGVSVNAIWSSPDSDVEYHPTSVFEQGHNMATDLKF